MSKSPVNSSKESRGRRVTLFFESILGHIVSTNPFDEPFQIPEPHRLAIEFTNSASELTKKDTAPRSLTHRVTISSVCAHSMNESGLVCLSKCICVHLRILRPYFFPSSHLTKSTKIRRRSSSSCAAKYSRSTTRPRISGAMDIASCCCRRSRSQLPLSVVLTDAAVAPEQRFDGPSGAQGGQVRAVRISARVSRGGGKGLLRTRQSPISYVCLVA